MLPPWYSPWLKVSLALRMALTYPWDAAAWAEVRQHIAPMIWSMVRGFPFQFAYRVGGPSRTQGIDGEGLQPIPSAIKSPLASPADRYRFGRANYSVHARVEQPPIG